MAAAIAARWLVPPAVDVVQLTSRDVTETLVTTGKVRSVSRASVGAPVGGTVESVLVREGDRVRTGQLLLQLENADALAAVASARARLTEAEAALRRVTTITHPTNVAELESAELEARQRARDVERAKALYDAGAISRTDVEQAERLSEAAQARLTAARTAARNAAADGPERRSAEAAVAAARAETDAAGARVEQTRVRSPAKGTVLIRGVEPGDIVTPGSVLMEVALDGPTELLVLPDERVLGQLKPGLPAVASADAFPDQRFTARVERVAPVIDAQQGTVEVRPGVPDPPAYLVADMTVSVNIELARKSAVPTVPLAAVRSPLTDAAWVLVVRSGRAVRSPVKLGIRDSRFAELLDGVAAEDMIVLSPDEVSAGDRVRARRQ